MSLRTLENIFPYDLSNAVRWVWHEVHSVATALSSVERARPLLYVNFHLMGQIDEFKRTLATHAAQTHEHVSKLFNPDAVAKIDQMTRGRHVDAKVVRLYNDAVVALGVAHSAIRGAENLVAQVRPQLANGSMSERDRDTMHALASALSGHKKNYDTLFVEFRDHFERNRAYCLPMVRYTLLTAVMGDVDREFVKEGATCALCKEQINMLEDRVPRIECGHHFHNQCLFSHLEMTSTCPVCISHVESNPFVLINRGGHLLGIIKSVDLMSVPELVYTADHVRRAAYSSRKTHTIHLAKHPAYAQERSEVKTIFWDEPYDEYRPVRYTHDAVLLDKKTGKKPVWADIELDWTETPLSAEAVNFAATVLSKRRTYEGSELGKLRPLVLHQGRPRNPVGRTGMTGRGLLGNYGPNHAADPLLTKFVYDIETKKTVLKMLVVQRSDTKQWAIPGGMVDAGEVVTEAAVRELIEEGYLGDSLEDQKARLAKLKAIFSKAFTEHAIVVYSGYVDDPRNTDHAWMETACYHLHLDDSDTFKEINVLQSSAGSDAIDTKWLEIKPGKDGSDFDNLYASHREMVLTALRKRPWLFAETLALFGETSGEHI